jgi:hypothetical protein
MTSLSTHFMATDVNATFRQVAFASLGAGTTVVCLKHDGITDSVRDRLKMSVKMLDSWSVHALSTRPGNPSGPATWLMLTCLKVLFTSATLVHASVLLASKQA